MQIQSCSCWLQLLGFDTRVQRYVCVLVEQVCVEFKVLSLCADCPTDSADGQNLNDLLAGSVAHLPNVI